MQDENLEGFIATGARVMAADRPDLWADTAAATEHLRRWVNDILTSKVHRNKKGRIRKRTAISSGGYMIERIDTKSDSGEVNWSLVRHIVDFDYWNRDDDALLFDWTDSSALLKATP